MHESALAMAASIVSRGEYATVGAVVHALCIRFGVHRLEDPPLCMSVHAVPALSLLLHIECATAAAVDAFVATHAIACFKDLEHHVVSALHLACTVPLSQAAHAGQLVAQLRLFEQFGVGPLARHPVVRTRWPMPASGSDAHLIDYNHAAQHLLNLLVAGRGDHSTRSGMALSAVEFGRGLVEATGNSLDELGVLINPTELPRTIHSLRHAAHAARQLEAETTRQALRRVQSELERTRSSGGARGGTSAKTATHSAQNGRTAQVPLCAAYESAACPTLHPPSQRAVERVLSRCRTLVGTNGCAPTYSAMLVAVERMATPSMPAVPQGQRGRKRMRAAAAAADSNGETGATAGWYSERDPTLTLDRATALAVVAEYLMMHLGSRKWRARRWSASPETADAAEAESASVSDRPLRDHPPHPPTSSPSEQSKGAVPSAGQSKGAVPSAGQSKGAVPSAGQPMGAVPSAGQPMDGIDGCNDGHGEKDGGAVDGNSSANGSTNDSDSSDDSDDDSDSSDSSDSSDDGDDGDNDVCREGGRDGKPSLELETAAVRGSPAADSQPTWGGESAGVGDQSSADNDCADAAARGVSSHAAVDPNEIDIGSDTEGVRSSSGAAAPTERSSGLHLPPPACKHVEVCTTAHNTRTHVCARPSDAVPSLPTRMHSVATATSGLARQMADGVALGAAGCLPWQGNLAVRNELDISDRSSVGRWGEALVHNFLLTTLPPTRTVHWLNEQQETRAPYDLTVSTYGQAAHRGGRGPLATTFIEVKTTRYADNNVFALSFNEWQFLSSEPPVHYQIYRVSGVGGPPAGVRITVIEDVLQAVKDGSIRLCMAI